MLDENPEGGGELDFFIIINWIRKLTWEEWVGS